MRNAVVHSLSLLEFKPLKAAAYLFALRLAGAACSPCFPGLVVLFHFMDICISEAHPGCNLKKDSNEQFESFFPPKKSLMLVYMN